MSTRSPSFLFQQPVEHAFDAGQVVLDVSDYDALDLGLAALLHLFEQGIVTTEHEDCFRAAVLQLVLQLALGVERIGGDDDAARFQDAVIDDDELRQVGHVDDGPVAFLETVGDQPGGYRIGGLVHFGIGEGAVLKEHGRIAGHTAGGLLKKVLNGVRGNVDGLRHALVVALRPGLVGIVQAHSLTPWFT